MIQDGTKLKVADNSGAKMVKCFKILKGSKRRYASLGDIIIASVKDAEPRRQVKKGDVIRGVVVRQKKNYRRVDGTYIKFDDNAIAIINKNNEPVGGRIIGPVARELKEKGFQKIVSLAPEVL